ncbi:MAG: hypothetical protein Q3979_03420 [Actinomycetaceae bacterium]|nr:hypothetical protein [Actinomycetaceae bacterium]
MANLDSWTACADLLHSRFACDDAGSRHIRAKLDGTPVMVWLGRAQGEAGYDVVHVACPLLGAGHARDAGARAAGPDGTHTPGGGDAQTPSSANAATLAAAIGDFPLGALRLLGEHIHLHASFRLGHLTDSTLDASVRLLVAETQALERETSGQQGQGTQADQATQPGEAVPVGQATQAGAQEEGADMPGSHPRARDRENARGGEA